MSGRRSAPPGLPFRRRVARALRQTGEDVADHLRLSLAHLVKASDDVARVIVNSLPLQGLDALGSEILGEYEDVARDAAQRVLAQIGVDQSSELVDQVNARAVAYARERAAELIGRTRNAAGDLVDNPDARWSIDQGTRDLVRAAIADGLEENIGLDDIIDRVMETGAFSEERAELIARTEIAGANSEGALIGYAEAAAAGVTVRKEWILGPNPCEVCQANADQGPIELDEDFDSGDSAPPAHPHCECAISPVVDED